MIDICCIYTVNSWKKCTLPPAVTAWTKLTSTSTVHRRRLTSKVIFNDETQLQIQKKSVKLHSIQRTFPRNSAQFWVFWPVPVEVSNLKVFFKRCPYWLGQWDKRENPNFAFFSWEILKWFIHIYHNIFFKIWPYWLGWYPTWSYLIDLVIEPYSTTWDSK